MLLGIIKPHKKFGNVSSKILEVPAIFVYTKEFPKKYKGKNATKPFLLSFLAGRSNQLLVFTKLLHFYSFFERQPYCSRLRPYGHMAIIWPYGHKAILPYGFKGGLYGVYGTSNKNAAFLWRLDVDWTSLQEMRAKWFNSVFSFVFFRKFLCKYKNSRHF